jgi:hypothetical protein
MKMAMRDRQPKGVLSFRVLEVDTLPLAITSALGELVYWLPVRGHTTGRAEPRYCSSPPSRDPSETGEPLRCQTDRRDGSEEIEPRCFCPSQRLKRPNVTVAWDAVTMALRIIVVAELVALPLFTAD